MWQDGSRGRRCPWWSVMERMGLKPGPALQSLCISFPAAKSTLKTALNLPSAQGHHDTTGLKHLQVFSFVLPAWQGEWEPVSPHWGGPFGRVQLILVLSMRVGIPSSFGSLPLSVMIPSGRTGCALRAWLSPRPLGIWAGILLQRADLWFFPPFLLDLPLESRSKEKAWCVGVTLIQIAAYMWLFKRAWTL